MSRTPQKERGIAAEAHVTPPKQFCAGLNRDCRMQYPVGARFLHLGDYTKTAETFMRRRAEPARPDCRRPHGL